MDHQDWTPVFVKQANKASYQKPGSNNLLPKTSHKERGLNEAIENGQLKVKKFDGTFGKEVQKFRLSKGWKQQDLSHRLNVNQKVINDIESGKAKYNPALMSKMKRLMSG